MNEIQQILKGFYVNTAIKMLIVCLLVLGLFLIRFLIFKALKTKKEKKYKNTLNDSVSTGTKNIIEKNTHDDLICPKCGSKLVLRTAKKGDNAGNQFYGCSSFPKCRYVKNL